MPQRRLGDNRPADSLYMSMSDGWVGIAVLLPVVAALVGIFTTRGTALVAFQPEMGASVALLAAIWLNRGLRAVGIAVAVLAVVGFMIPFYGWSIDWDISLALVAAHAAMAISVVALYLPMARRFSDHYVGPFLSLIAALLVCSIPAGLLVSAVSTGRTALDLNFLEVAALWSTSAFLGGLLIAPLGLFLLPPAVGLARGSGRDLEGILSTVLVVAIAVLVSATSTNWLLWLLVPPTLWAAIRVGPRWVAGQLTLTTFVFVFFATFALDEVDRESVWVSVLAAQIAVLSLALSIPMVALAVNAFRHERDRAEAALELAQRDALTGVFNRRALNDVVDSALMDALAKETQLAVVYVDVDDFKQVNDTFGHAAGDEVLIEVGQRLRAGLRKTDSAVRVGGDEFVVVLSDLAERSAADTALASLRVGLDEPFEVSGRMLPIRVSLGMALGSGRSNRDALLAEADRALYSEKSLRHQA